MANLRVKDGHARLQISEHDRSLRLLASYGSISTGSYKKDPVQEGTGTSDSGL